MKPILFNSEMVRAILDGRKTQTRRICKAKSSTPLSGYSGEALDALIRHHSPYGKVGDKLWVRESWWDKGYWETDKNFKRHWIRFRPEEKIDFYYSADGDPTEIRGSYNSVGPCIYLRKHPSIHMFKKYARIFLEITDIRVERVQDITHADILKEGIIVDPKRAYPDSIKNDWIELWNSIHGKDVGKIRVWVIEFKRVEK